ncbi:Uncharacterized protein At1g65710 [Linum perenne]
MGSCFSKKTVCSSVTNAASPAGEVQQKREEDEREEKKEVFVIKHRDSHESNGQRRSPSPAPSPEVVLESGKVSTTTSMAVRTSSCTKEEVEAILIQCGRLSRNNSFGTPGKAASVGGGGGGGSVGRRYSGSKRSFDFDNEEGEVVVVDEARDSRREQRHSRSSRNSSPAAQGRRRRTPSRETDQRSGSRERGSSGTGNGRRVSRSPGRRSENTTTTAPATANAAAGNKPGKMVSVPPTVAASTSSNKTNAVEAAQQTTTAAAVKRISVKRNTAGGETGLRSATASPRARSPARGATPTTNQQQQQPSLSRNSSRKAEQSPKRRNALAEIDPSSLAYPQANVNRAQENTQPIQKPNPETLKQQSLSRTRSARRSRDLDINIEALLNPQNPQQPTSYTSLLLEDIQNFHQKKNNNNGSNPNPNPIPACVMKACSIMEAVADLNSTTSSNLSSTLCEDHHRRVVPKEAKVDPFVVESEVVTMDDLMEPSFHKYVTVRRGGSSSSTCDMDNKQEESTGSNSYVGWEPNSADSTDRWSSRGEKSNGKEEEEMNPSPVPAPLGLGIGQRVHGLSERSSGIGRVMEEARMGFSGQENGIGKGRFGNRSNHLLTTT